MHGTHYPATTAMDVQGLRRALAPRSVYLGSPSYQPSQQADLYTGGIDGDGVFGVYDSRCAFCAEAGCRLCRWLRLPRIRSLRRWLRHPALSRLRR
jgi:hypothetical protein